MPKDRIAANHTIIGFIGVMILGLSLAGISPDMAYGAALRNWHVASTGLSDEDADGSAQHPFLSIQTAIDTAADGETIHVRAGIYTEHLHIKGKNIIIQSMEGPETTILEEKSGKKSADNGSIVTFEDATGKLDGFTIRGGIGTAMDPYGIGIYRSCGGGILCIESSPILSNLIITDNYLLGDRASGAGIFCHENSSPSLVNVLITQNSAYYGGAIYCYGESRPSLMNVTISDNSAREGGGIYCAADSSVSIINSILWNNQPREIFGSLYETQHPIDISYSDVQGGEEGIAFYSVVVDIPIYEGGSVNWLGGNIDSDPLFTESENGDYHLSYNSPCIGSGTLENAPSADLEGTPRPGPAQSDPDMGAYENAKYPVYDPPTPQDDSAETDENVPVKISVLANDSGEKLSIVSVTPPGNGKSVNNNDGTVSYTPNQEFWGTDTFTYTVRNVMGYTASATVMILIDPRPRELYVDGSLVGEETGGPESPYSTISQAISNAPPNCTIRVANGMYMEALSIRDISRIGVEGGWNNESGIWRRDDPLDPNATAIMGNESSISVHVKNAPQAKLEGVTILSSATGVRVENSDDVLISDNIIHVYADATHSEGIYFENSSGDILRNRFHIVNNTNGAYGITMKALAGNVRIENNILYMLQGGDIAGIREIGSKASPVALLNNEFYTDETAALYRDGNGKGNVMTCAHLNDDTLKDIPERGGNFCNLLPPYMPCEPPCAEVVSIPPPQDTDTDGMPDNWEIYYFGDLSNNGTGDKDGDGKTDLEEYADMASPVNWNMRVIITPQGATDAGARWQLDDGIVWHQSGETLSGISSGDHTLTFKVISGWEAPEKQTLTINNGGTVSVTVRYALGSYTLNLSEDGGTSCGGSVKTNGDLRELPWQGQFRSGEEISLEAIPDEECNFINWFGGIVSEENPATFTMDTNKTIRVTFEERPEHFPQPVPTNISMDIFGKIYSSSDRVISDRDEVAAFVDDGNGGLLLVGSGVYGENLSGNYGLIHVYGDDTTTPEKDGAGLGDPVMLKAYDKSKRTEHELTLIRGNNLWERGVQKECDWIYRVNVRQRIPLHIGWNLFSFSVNKCYYVAAKPACNMIEGIEYEEVESISSILSSIDGQYAAVRGFDCTGAKTYNSGPWSDMQYMAAGYAYWIKINEDAVVDTSGLIYLELEGTSVSGDTAIPLQPGWNLVGYLGNKVLHTGTDPTITFPENRVMCHILLDDISEAFCSIAGQYAYVRGFDETGAKSYNLTPWSDMKYVGPGYGYWLRISDGEDATLVWDSPCMTCEEY